MYTSVNIALILHHVITTNIKVMFENIQIIASKSCVKCIFISDRLAIALSRNCSSCSYFMLVNSRVPPLTQYKTATEAVNGR